MVDNITRPRRDADSFDVRGSVRSLIDAARMHRWLVAAVTAMTLVLVLLYAWIWPPVYQAEATIMGEREIDSARDTFYGGWNVFRKDDHRTELELMVSGPVLVEVAQKLNLRYEDVYHPFMSHLTFLWEESFVGRHYRDFKDYLLPPDPDAPRADRQALGRIVVDLRAGIALDPVHEAIVGRLSVKGPNRRVSEIANTIVDVYAVQRTQRYQKEAERAVEVLGHEVERAAATLKRVEARRVEFANANGLTFDLQRESQDVKALTELEQGIGGTKVKIAALEASLATVGRQLADQPATQKTATFFELNAIRELLRAKQLELQTALLSQRNRYREDSPEIREMLTNLSQLDDLLKSAPDKIEKASTESINTTRQQMEATANTQRVELASARASVALLEQITGNLRTRLLSVPSLQNGLRGFDRELLLANETYHQLAVKLAQANVSKVTTQATIPSIRVVEYASPPGEKSAPKLKYLIPAALVAGLLLGVAAAQIKRFGAGRVRRGFWGRRMGDALVYGVATVVPDWQPLVVLPPASTPMGATPVTPTGRGRPGEDS